MSDDNIKLLPNVEQDELKRILGLRDANRFPTESDILFLKARVKYLTQAEIKQFGLGLVVAGIPFEIEEKLPLGVVDAPEPIKVAKKGKRIAKKAIVAKKVAGKSAKKVIKKKK